MEMSFENWEKAMLFLAGRTDDAFEALLVMKAQQKVDTGVIASLLATHPNPALFAEQWRQISAATLPVEHIANLQKETPAAVQQAFDERTEFWESLLRKVTGQTTG